MSLWNLLHEISSLSLSHTPAPSTYITPPHPPPAPHLVLHSCSDGPDLEPGSSIYLFPWLCAIIITRLQMFEGKDFTFFLKRNPTLTPFMIYWVEAQWDVTQLNLQPPQLQQQRCESSSLELAAALLLCLCTCATGGDFLLKQSPDLCARLWIHNCFVKWTKADETFPNGKLGMEVFQISSFSDIPSLIECKSGCSWFSCTAGPLALWHKCLTLPEWASVPGQAVSWRHSTERHDG